jgi:hypothetical protein
MTLNGSGETLISPTRVGDLKFVKSSRVEVPDLDLHGLLQ